MLANVCKIFYFFFTFFVVDLVKFLELLSKEINLPDTLENDRSNLLRRSKTSLASAGQRSSSPEPYLDMNAGKGKGLSVVKSGEVNTINDNNNHQQQLTEYIDTDNPRVSRHSAQDYYETFQEFTSKSSANDEQDKLKIIYRSFSTEQTRSKSHKCGPLFQKEERRLFGFQLFDQFRELWVGKKFLALFYFYFYVINCIFLELLITNVRCVLGEF